MTGPKSKRLTSESSGKTVNEPSFSVNSHAEYLSNSGKKVAEASPRNQMPRTKALDRSALMDLMLFPQNTAEMVIVPSNKEGTGFLNHCYDENFLSGFISEMEFNAIILICSRIAAKAYSTKNIIDRQSIPERMQLFIGLSALIGLVGILLLYFAASNNSVTLEVIASIILAPSILTIFAINIYVWKRNKPESITFDRMVKK